MSQSSSKPSLTQPSPTGAVKSQFEVTTAQSTQSDKLLYFPQGNNKSVFQNVRQQKDIGEVFIESQTFKVDTDGNIENLNSTDKVILHSGARNKTFQSFTEKNISVNLRAVNISIGRIMLLWNLCQKEFLNSISNLEVCIANNTTKIKAFQIKLKKINVFSLGKGYFWCKCMCTCIQSAECLKIIDPHV